MKLSIISAAMCATLAWGNLAQAATPTEKCQQAKLKAQGKLQACLKKNAAGIIGGKTDVSTLCQGKFTAALDKADAKATASGTSCRFIDNGDQTLSDLDTGLMWEKKDTSGGDHDQGNTYTWNSSSGSAANGTAFTSFLSSLNGANDGVGFAGNTDWRLPTIEELQGIVDLSHTPTIDPAFGITAGFSYWSRTNKVADGFQAQDLNFGSGTSGTAAKSGAERVRAVRGGL